MTVFKAPSFGASLSEVDKAGMNGHTWGMECAKCLLAYNVRSRTQLLQLAPEGFVFSPHSFKLSEQKNMVMSIPEHCC
jgi:hypothetical protein